MKKYIYLSALTALILLTVSCNDTRKANVPASATNVNNGNAKPANAVPSSSSPIPIPSKRPGTPVAKGTYAKLKGYALAAPHGNTRFWIDENDYWHKTSLQGEDITVFVSHDDMVRAVFYLVRPDDSVLFDGGDIVEKHLLPRLIAHSQNPDSLKLEEAQDDGR